MSEDQKTNHDKVVKAIGQEWIDECTQALLEFATSGDLFDAATDKLTDHRGFSYTTTIEPDEASVCAFDVAFFDVLEAAVEGLRRAWGGYHGTLKPED